MTNTSAIGHVIAGIFSLLIGASLLNMNLLWVVLGIHIFCAVPAVGIWMGGFENMEDASFKRSNFMIIGLIIWRCVLSAIFFGIGYVGYLLFA